MVKNIYRDEKFIYIKHGDRTTYDIPLSRCQTAGECLDWIHQLHVKTWFTAELEKEFIDLLFETIPVCLWSGGGKKIK